MKNWLGIIKNMKHKKIAQYQKENGLDFNPLPLVLPTKLFYMRCSSLRWGPFLVLIIMKSIHVFAQIISILTGPLFFHFLQ